VDGDFVYVAFNSGELVIVRAEDGAVQVRQQLLVNGHRVVPLSLAGAGVNRLAIGTLDGRVLDCSITGSPPSEKPCSVRPVEHSSPVDSGTGRSREVCRRSE
jgi:hypothetical protein